MSTFYLDYENGSDAGTGADWANAWKTITSGATAARIAPGDTIRIAKSPDPTSIGNGTWTNASKSVVLATAQTLFIDDCETAWTANGSGDVTVARTTLSTSPYGKIGSYYMKFTFDSAVQSTGIMQAYYALAGSTDFSSYQKITFWFYNTGALTTAGTLQIALCSDTAGATPVDVFDIPAIAATAGWIPLTLTKSGGGNLGSSIQSIALYTGTSGTSDLNSKIVYLDNIHACTTSGLNLQSLISKNSAAQGGTEAWHHLRGISSDGLTLTLDTGSNTSTSNTKTYAGTTETVTTYKRETIKTDFNTSASGSQAVMQDYGTAGNPITYSGGWNTSTNTRDGATYFDGQNGFGFGLDMEYRGWQTVEYIGLVRYTYGIRTSSYSSTYVFGFVLKMESICGCSNGIILRGCSGADVTALSVNFNSYGIANNGESEWRAYIHDLQICSNLYTAISNANGFKSVYKNITAKGNGSTGVIQTNGQLTIIDSDITDMKIGEDCYLRNTTIETETALVTQNTDALLYSWRHDDTDNNHWIFGYYCNAYSQTTTRHTASGLAWTIRPSSSSRASYYPFKFKVADVLCKTASQAVTVTCYVKKEHATNIAAKLICPGGQLAGVASDVEDTKASDTDWEQLSVNFTPTEVGVIEVYVYVWYVAAAGDVYVDDVGVTYG